MAAGGDLARPCATCGQTASSSCVRCGLPSCAVHRPPADRRCGECEARFRRHRPARFVTYVLALVLASFALVVVLFFLVLATGGGALGVAPLILLGSFP